VRFDDPALVRREYASEKRLRERRRAFKELVVGPNAEDLAFDAVAEVSPARVLEVGSGLGLFADRLVRELASGVVAVDLSPRMVELARSRGIEARVADVQDLPYADAEFDVVVANWVLYHVPDLDLALREVARVLRPDGRLVAATFGEDHLRELWERLDNVHVAGRGFNRESAAESLLRRFASVGRRDADGVVVFPDRASVRRYVAATISGPHLAELVDDAFPSAPFRARSVQAVFVAEQPL
jgi:SAM-dependent methyltransferase